MPKSTHISANDPISFLLMTEKYSTLYMYHIFFIYASVKWHLGCVHVPVIVNNAPMNFEVNVSFWIIVFVQDICTVVVLLGHMVVLLLVLWEISIVFSTVTAPIHILNNQCTRIPFTSSPTFVICVLFDDSHSDRWEVISHCGLDLYFSDD